MTQNHTHSLDEFCKLQRRRVRDHLKKGTDRLRMRLEAERDRQAGQAGDLPPASRHGRRGRMPGLDDYDSMMG